jgi:hypothetical protein
VVLEEIETMRKRKDDTEPKRFARRLCQSEAYLAEAQRLSQTGSWSWNPWACERSR